jgi:hypothetical protein
MSIARLLLLVRGVTTDKTAGDGSISLFGGALSILFAGLELRKGSGFYLFGED